MNNVKSITRSLMAIVQCQVLLAAVTLDLFRLVTAQSCPAGYTFNLTTSYCYKSSTTVASRSDADRICKSTGGRLITVESSAAQTVLVSLVQEEKTYWIGLNKTSSDWHYVTVSSSTKVFIQAQGCYLMSPQYSMFDYLYSVNDSYTPPQCIRDCALQGFLYAAVTRWNQTGTKLECRCSNQFSPNYTLINPCTYLCPSNSSFYCGSDNFADGFGNSYYNVSLSVYRTRDILTTYNGWGRAQPNNNYFSQLSPFQSCMALDFTVTGRQRGWNDEPCAEIFFQAGNGINPNYGHICAYDAQDSTSCQTNHNGATYNVGRCYEMIWWSSLTWFKARQNCVSRGGDLLRVDDVDLFNAIANTVGNNIARFWIDGTRDTWTWSDGQLANGYSNWYSGSPTAENNQCVTVSSSNNWVWTDVDCTSSQNYYICEADVLSGPASTSTSTSTRTSTVNTASSSISTSSTTPTTTTRPSTTTSVSTISSSTLSGSASTSTGTRTSTVSTPSSSTSTSTAATPTTTNRLSTASSASTVAGSTSTMLLVSATTTSATTTAAATADILPTESTSTTTTTTTTTMASLLSTSTAPTMTPPVGEVVVSTTMSTGYSVSVPNSPGVIIAIIITAIVMVATTVRMFVSCLEKTSRDGV